MRSHHAVVWAAVGLALSLSRSAPAQSRDTPTAQALKYFAAQASGDPVATVRALRPPAISAEERARVLETLPEYGALTPHDEEESKIRALDPILDYHERRHIFHIVLIDEPQVIVGLYGRSVLLLSRPALQILSTSELQAMVAHEMGHDYFWPDYDKLSRNHDPKGRQLLELKCDGIAGLTLAALGLEVAGLHEGIRKMWSANERLGATAGAEGYPSLRQRRAFMSALLSKHKQ